MPDEPLWGGTIGWGNYSAIRVDYTHHNIAAYNSAFPNGPSEYDISRGDFVISAYNSPYPMDILSAPGSISGCFNGALVFWPVLSVPQKLSIQWVWVDMIGNLNIEGLYGRLRQPRIDMEYNYGGTDASGNTHIFAATGRYDTRGGRRMELYKRDSTVTAPPSGSGGGSHYWADWTSVWVNANPPW